MSIWREVKRVRSNGLVVCVDQFIGKGPLEFSIEIRYELPDLPGQPKNPLGPKTDRFIPVKVEGKGKVSITGVGPKLAELLAEAESWIAEEAQRDEDARIEEQRAQELRQEKRLDLVPRGQQKGTMTPRTGKTERDRKRRQAKGKIPA